MLQARGLKKTFYPGTVNARVALNNLSLTLEDGDFAAVIGGNGAGKEHPAQRGGRRDNRR